MNLPSFLGDLRDGAPVRRSGGAAVTRWAPAGELVLTSGRVVACDPLVNLGTPPFALAIPAGRYPVVLGLLDGEVAYALLRVAEAAPARWEPAWAVGEEPGGPVRGYGVDAGVGCFLDAEAADRLRDRERADLERRCAAVIAAGVDPADGDAWHRALGALPPAFDLLGALRAQGLGGARPACVAIDEATGLNLIAFSSGAGDGCYPSYWGLSASGAPACLVTDFGLLPDELADEASEPPPPPTFLSGEESARRFLDLLVARGALLLDPGADVGALARGAARWFAPRARRHGRGERLGAWLIAQPGVVELFVEDEELSALLEEW